MGDEWWGMSLVWTTATVGLDFGYQLVQSGYGAQSPITLVSVSHEHVLTGGAFRV